MAVTKITWENKTGIQNDASVARKNKVVDEDMNEIKQAVNNNADETTLTKNQIGNMQSLMQEIASSDLTNKNNISNLQSRTTALETDNIQNKSDISTLKSDNQTNKSNISTMQSQISDMQQEQQTQNTNIEELQENDIEQDLLISKLKNALLNAETEEAKSLYVEDANKFGSLEVLGNHEQEMSSQGKNYFTGNKITSGTAVGVTYSFDNSILKVNGTTSASGNIILDVPTGVRLPAGTYTYTIKVASGNYQRPLNTDFAFYLRSANDYITGDLGTSGITGSSINNNIYSKTFTTTEEIEIYLRIFVNASGIVFNNLELEIQIESGSEYTEFEQFVPNMPSPDYPSPVVCLGSNKNILNDEIFKNVKIENSASISGLGNVDIELKNTTYRTRIYFADGTYVTDNNLVLYAYNSSNQNLFILSNTKSIQVTNAEQVKYVKLAYNTTGISTYQGKIIKGIKIEKQETENASPTSYSPYGQGSTRISEINKNWFNKDNLKQIAGTANFEVLENGIKITGPNAAPTQGCVFKLFNIANYKGETFTIKAKWTPSANNAGRIILGLCSEDGSQRNAVMYLDESGGYTSYTIPENLGNTKYLAAWFYANVETSNAGDYVVYKEIQIELGDTATDYIEHEQTDYILDIQQEMLSGDYFVKEADGWKEVHNYPKYEITGNETMLLTDNTVDETYLFRIDSKTFPLENYSLDYIMNYFTADTARTTTNTIGSYIFDNRLRIRVPASIAATTEEIKSWLQEKYNSGNPVYIYYKEESLTKLLCTEAQNAVLEELSNLELFDGVNNIITAEDIALLKLKYALDVKTYVNNLIASQTTTEEA